MSHSETEKLFNLVEENVLKDWTIEPLNQNGIPGYSEQGRNSERLTLTFPSGQKLVLSTWCSGCLENTGFSVL